MKTKLVKGMTKQGSVKITKHCTQCEKDKALGEFYTSNSTSAKEGRHHICKKCLPKLIDFGNIGDIQQLLMELNKPFLSGVWRASIRESNGNGSSAFGLYLKNVYLNHKNLTWKNSRLESDETNEQRQVAHDRFKSESADELIITSDLIRKWGKNYDSEGYYKLEDFYNKMMTSNKIESHQDETYLKKLAVISLKMDIELEKGNYSQVKQLGDLFSKYMADSKFRAMDQTDASKTGGLRTFSQIYAEVEKDEFIPPWEEYRQIKGLEQDIVDRTIMYILNYTLKINKVASLTEPPMDTPELDEVSRDKDE